MLFDQVRDICWPLSLAFLGLWAVHLVHLRLAGRYPALFGYLVAAFLTGLGGYIIHHMAAAKLLGRSFYFWYWAVTQPVLWMLLFGVLFESFSRMAEGYEGLRRMGRTVVYGLAIGIVFVLGLVWILDPFENPDKRFWNSVLLIQQQSVYMATAGSVLLLLAIRRFFRLPVSRNVAITLGAFGFYFVSVASMITIRSYVGYQQNSMDDAMDVVGLGIYCVCLLFGATAFSRGGETVVRDRRLDIQAQPALASAAARLRDVNEQMAKAVMR